MAKPRVIIADTDEGYISTIQLKFVKEYFDKIELEIITDKEYFDELFSKPQKADILIVSEELYDDTLQKHNISNIFLMMEKEEEEQTGDLNVSRMYKYTSIKEIFNEITGKSSQTLNLDENEKKKTQVVLVTSAAGGVGKTTIALGISECLAKNYKRVLYINAGRLQNFKYAFNNKTVISESEIYACLINPTDRIYEDIKHVIRNENMYYLPAFKASLISLGIKYNIYSQIVVAAKRSNDYDFIVVDMDSSFDNEKIKFLDLADRVFIITDQSYNSVTATNDLVLNINCANADKYLFLCNRYDKDKKNALLMSDINKKYSIDEYVEKIKSEGTLDLEHISASIGIKKVTYMVM